MARELLFSLTKKDFEIQTFRSGGKGGQHQNKTDSGVRIIHNESGAIGESREHRSQSQNKKTAFIRLVNSNKFKIWHTRKSHELMGLLKTEEQIKREVEEMVERDLENGNIKIEYME